MPTTEVLVPVDDGEVPVLVLGTEPAAEAPSNGLVAGLGICFGGPLVLLGASTPS